MVEHQTGAGSGLRLRVGDPAQSLEIASFGQSASKSVSKQFSSIFAGTDLETWLREEGIDTITLVGYMKNNRVLVSAAAAEPLGFTVGVLSDATGARPVTAARASPPAAP